MIKISIIRALWSGQQPKLFDGIPNFILQLTAFGGIECLLVGICDLLHSIEMSRMCLNAKGYVKRKHSANILPMIQEEEENGAGLRLAFIDLDGHPELCLEPKIAPVSNLSFYLIRINHGEK